MILMICCFKCLAPQLTILLLTLSFSTYQGITLGSLLNYCLTYLISLSLLAFVNKKYEWVGWSYIKHDSEKENVDTDTLHLLGVPCGVKSTAAPHRPSPVVP